MRAEQYDTTDPKLFEPHEIPVIGAPPVEVFVVEHHDRDHNAVIFATEDAALRSKQAKSGIWNVHRRTARIKP